MIIYMNTSALRHIRGSVIFLTINFPQQSLSKLGRSRLKIWKNLVAGLLVHPKVNSFSRDIYVHDSDVAKNLHYRNG